MIQILVIGMHPNYGGIEAFVMNYYRNIDKSKFSFDFIDMYNGLAYAQELERTDSKIFRVPPFKKHPISSAKKLRAIVAKNRYDIIHIQMNEAVNIMPLLAVYHYKACPIVIGHSHNSKLAPEFSFFKKIMHWIDVRMLRHLQIVKWACSVEAGEWLWGESFDIANVIPNAIDMTRFQRIPSTRKQLREKCGFGKSDQLVGFVGRLCDQKNVMFLPEILSELKMRSSNYKLLIVGDGNLRAPLTDKFKRLGLLPDVHFVGLCEDAAPWYSAMDAFILPSLFEGFGIVGLEAQASRLPCFVSNAVPDELNVTGTVKYLPIDQGAKIWADAIHAALLDKSTIQYAFSKEYDITYAAMRLEERYTRLVKKDKTERASP